MKTEYYNYNNEKLLKLNEEDLVRNASLIETIYKDYEVLRGEVIMNRSTPVLVISGYFIAKVKNNISEPQKLSFLQINNRTIKAFVERK